MTHPQQTNQVNQSNAGREMDADDDGDDNKQNDGGDCEFDDPELAAPLHHLTRRIEGVNADEHTTNGASTTHTKQHQQHRHRCPHHEIHGLLVKMWHAGSMLRMDTESRFASLVLLHRYYAAMYNGMKGQQSLLTKNWKWIGAACIVLALKTEESTRRRLRDVMNVAHVLDFGLETLTPEGTFACQTVPAIDGQYWKDKAALVETEQHVLRMLRFDTVVCHPHRIVLLIWQDHNNDSHDGAGAGILQTALTSLNDTLFHAPALLMRAVLLASASLATAGFPVLSSSSSSASSSSSCSSSAWHEQYGVSIDELKKAVECLQHCRHQSNLVEMDDRAKVLSGPSEQPTEATTPPTAATATATTTTTATPQKTKQTAKKAKGKSRNKHKPPRSLVDKRRASH